MRRQRASETTTSICFVVAFSLLQGLACVTHAGTEGRVVALPGNSFGVVEADSSAASRLEAQYPNRLRRVSTQPNAIRLNNVAVVLPRTPVVALFGPSQSSGQPSTELEDTQTDCTNRQVSTPTDEFIVVCVDSANHVSERDKRALIAFVDFASKESLALAAHVSSETEWDALQRALGVSDGAVAGVRFREVRYGDGLASGQIRIQRLQK